MAKITRWISNKASLYDLIQARVPDSSKFIPTNNGDHISVHYLFKELQQVEIIGQVKAPGIYHYYNSMTFNDLLVLGGGFNTVIGIHQQQIFRLQLSDELPQSVIQITIHPQQGQIAIVGARFKTGFK